MKVTTTTSSSERPPSSPLVNFRLQAEGPSGGSESVPPAVDVCSRRRGLQNPFHHLREDALFGSLARVVGFARIAGRRALAAVERRVRRRLRLVEKVLQQERRFFEIEGVQLAHGEAQLPLELPTE